jgi:hypothetical protein
MVGGYGEYRPIATNSKKGNEENRRVEVYLVSMPTNSLRATDTESTVAVPTNTKPAAATEAEEDNLK